MIPWGIFLLLYFGLSTSCRLFGSRSLVGMKTYLRVIFSYGMNLQVSYLFVATSSSSYQLIGFSDASKKGYSAVVYLRCGDLHSEGQISKYLVWSYVAY
ncbi:hypothetical protein J437_LFUL017766 [Ladona fulva]|uniref:Uncharacterized protein n=1 Tax=Ladona fulva TaxID=123851 RepID=A0A8K0KQN4_LADFU|nr:hypothetical protein J437_LFUL017766 [Ladona fulva]